MKNNILLPKNNLPMQEDYPAKKKKNSYKEELKYFLRHNNKAFLVGKMV